VWFGKRTDFEKVQQETEDILNNVRDFKRLGSSISRFYQELKKDIEIIESHRAKFRQLSKQVDFLAVSDQDVKSWDAETLSVSLHGWNLPDCAKTFFENGISGYAFCNDLNEQDFKNMGIEDDLKLRRLKNLQASPGRRPSTADHESGASGRVALFCPSFQPALLVELD